MPKPIKHGLGRGLGALLGDDAQVSSPLPQEGEERDLVMNIRISAIDPNREQPRRRFDEEALKTLADSIRSVGVIQPIIVRQNGDRYQIIAGERRWRAARMAGLGEIPAIVRDFNEIQRLEVALIENLQRDDLNPVEQAAGIKNLMDQCGYTQEAAAERLGMSRPAVANLIRLLMLPEDVQRLLIEGNLSAGHARTLVPLTDEAQQIKLAEHTVAQGLSVRQLERLVRELQATATQQRAPEKPSAMHDPASRELLRMARDVFGTKAQLEGDASKGKLVLHYYSPDDLQRIWDILETLRQNQ